jgi:hypothetical protein
MLDRQLYKFYISYRLKGRIQIEWIEGMNLRHAKEKVEMRYGDASDLMDWTNEKDEDLQLYLVKMRAKEEVQYQKELGKTFI